jgi:4'-phosphopantetheinyl transferase EntD
MPIIKSPHTPPGRGTASATGALRAAVELPYRWLERSAERAGVWGKAFFSAKESIYKALYPGVRVFLDFQSMQIELEPLAEGRYRWQAELQIDWGPFRRGERFGPGVLGIDESWILTAIALPFGSLSAARAPTAGR